MKQRRQRETENTTEEHKRTQVVEIETIQQMEKHQHKCCYYALQ